MSNESNVSQSVTAFDMCATSGTNVAQFYLYFKYKSVYVHENECILIKHGEIEDSKRSLNIQSDYKI